MKKTFFLSLFSAVLFLMPIANVHAGAEENLLDTLERTFQELYSIEGSHEFSINDILEADANHTSIYYKGDSHIFEEWDVHFNTASLLDDFGWDIFLMEGDFTGDEELYFRNEDMTIWYQMSNLDLTIKEDGEGNYPKRIMEGYFEFMHFFENKYIQINLMEYLDMMVYMGGYEVEELAQLIVVMLEDHQAFMLEATEILLDSGFFDVEEIGKTYYISLEKNPKLIHPEELLEFARYFGMSEDEIEYEKDMFNEHDRAYFEADWPEIHDMIDLQITLITDGRKITDVQVLLDIMFDYDVEEFNYETYEYTVIDTVPVHIHMLSNNQISQGSDRIPFPNETDDIVNLSKVLDAVWALEEYYASIWEDYEYEYDYDDYYEYNSEETWESEPSCGYYDEYGDMTGGCGRYPIYDSTWDDIALILDMQWQTPEGYLDDETRKYIAQISHPLRQYVKYLILHDNGYDFTNLHPEGSNPEAMLTASELDDLLLMYSYNYYSIDPVEDYPVSKQAFLDQVLSLYYPEIVNSYTFENWDAIYTDAYDAGLTDTDFSGNYDDITHEEAFTILARVLYVREFMNM